MFSFIRCRISRLPWLHFFLLLLLAVNIEAKADLDKFFSDGVRRYWPWRSGNNGCRGHADDLENSYKEASKLIDAAVAAITDLKVPRPSMLNPFNFSKRRIWNRKAQTVASIFGVKMDKKKGGPVTESNNVENLNYLEGIFIQMKEGMDNDKAESLPMSGSSFRAPRNPGLFCGTDGWKYYGPDDYDPGIPEDKLISDRTDPSFENGAWYFHYKYVWFKDSSTKTDSGICPPRALATTYDNGNFITWCDLAWSSLAKSINPQEVKRKAWLDEESRYSLSQTWVHELAHFYGCYRTEPNVPQLIDHPAVTSDGSPVIPPGKTYGISYVLNLAKNDPDKATHTADAYAMFAVAMYLSDWNWSTGQAK